MSGFKALRDISYKFESDLRLHSTNLICAKVNECSEDVIAKKTKDISFLTSKLRLLQAKTLAALPEIKESNKDELATINNYTDTVTWKLIEQEVVKTLNQTHAVKALVTAPDKRLDPILLERKKQIIAQVTEYSQKETTLLELDHILKEEETRIQEAQREWDRALGALKDSQNVPRSEDRDTGPLYKRLQTYVNKIELMRWLMSKLVITKSDYNWVTDPHKLFKFLRLTRHCHTIESYTDV